jgi:hypothetical protein
MAVQLQQVYTMARAGASGARRIFARPGLAVDKIVYTGGALKDKERAVRLFDRPSGYCARDARRSGHGRADGS